MSTLTKVLIVLLTISSIFLCGTVATYVANADNYKQKYTDLYDDLQAAKEREKNADRQLKENIEKMDQQKKELNEQISSLNMKIAALETNLDEAEREKALLLQKVNSWTSITRDFYQTTDKQGQLLKNAIEELDKLQKEQIKQRKELKETNAALIEKMAIIATQEEKNKRLLEERAELQVKLDQLLRQYGKVVAWPVPVTPTRATARPARPAEDIGLNGLVTAVDLRNSWAEISIGAADGVKENMKFHVTRGDEFICDILILNVDAEKAVGILDLVQKQPKVGDKVSTNL